jgi:hypothetical protein
MSAGTRAQMVRSAQGKAKEATMIRSAILSVTAAAVLAGCTTTTPDPERENGRQCFFSSSVSGFRNAPRSESGSERIYVDVGVRDTYLFEVFGTCRDLDFSNQIALVSRGGSSTICRGIDVDLLVPRPGFGSPDRCPVQMIHKLTAEERAARR